MRQLPKNITILGAAKSGIAAAVYLKAQGVNVFISDTMGSADLSQILVNAGLSDIPFEGGSHTNLCLQADAIILSPGIPSAIPLLLEARNKGIAVWSEIELAFCQTDATVIALTGSSGKSTTVSLIGAALTASGKKAVVAGNIGIAAISSIVELTPKDIAVLEVSSFQLETIEHFKPKVAGIINLLKNHLDRYPDEHAYYAAKRSIASNMDKQDTLVLNADDPILMSWAQSFKATTNVAFFGMGKPVHRGVYINGTNLISTMNESHEVILDTRDMKLVGLHNRYNAAAALAIALCAGANPQSALQGMNSFKGLPHRLEFVGNTKGVGFYNDSKSTTAESIQCAISAFNGNVHLIAGGRDKGCAFEILQNDLAKHVKDIVLIGEAKERMMQLFCDYVPVFKEETLEGAMECALSKAVSGDAIVFSPGCSSFDMFKNYEHRGDRFREIFADIRAKAKA